MRALLNSRMVQTLAAFALGGLVTAFALRGWVGVLMVSLALTLLSGAGYWVLRRARRLRKRWRQQVHQPLQIRGGPSKALLALGAGSVSLVGLYGLLGADSQAQEALASAAQWTSEEPPVLDSTDLDRIASDHSEVEQWAESLSTSTTGDEGSHETLLSAAIPAYVLFSGARSAWSAGRQYRRGSLSAKEGLRAVGADTATALARVIVVSSGARLAGMIVGGVPVIVLSGLAAGVAFEPALSRIHAWLLGDRSTMAEQHIRNRLGSLGRTFDKQRCLSTALFNLQSLKSESIAARPATSEPDWRSVLFPTLWTVVEEEYAELELREHERLQEFFDVLDERLRDAVLRRDYGELGEIVYFNRQHLLPGLEEQLQGPIAALDRALRQKGSKRRVSTADV